MNVLQVICRPLRTAKTFAPALKHRNYQLFFWGQGVSLIGTWMQRVALGWLVYQMTNSEWLLGVVGFSGQILAFVFTPLAGVLADRTNRRRLIVATQAVAMIQAFVLAGLTLAHMLTVWEIIVLSAVLGLVNAFDIPIRQAFVVEMLESRDDLPNAIALNSFLVNGAKLVGPSIAGVLIALLGEGMCFAFNAISFVAVIAALLAMRIKTAPGPKPDQSVFQNLRAGIVYTARSGPMRSVLALLAAVSLLGMSVMVLMPVFARDILRGGPHTFGFLMTVSGLGALGGAAFLAVRNKVDGLQGLMAGAAGLLGAALIGLSRSRDLVWALVFMGIMGFAMMVLMASCNTFLQSQVEDHMRGRVMGFYTMSFLGTAPFGSLISGGLAAEFGTPWAVAVSGAACVMASVAFATFRARHGRQAAS